MTMTQARRGATSAALLLGPGFIWSMHFLLLYASQSVFCTWLERSMSMMFVAVATAVAVVPLVLLIVRPMRGGGADTSAAFIDRTAAVLAFLSLCAVVWQTLPTFILPSCVAPL